MFISTDLTTPADLKPIDFEALEDVEDEEKRNAYAWGWKNNGFHAGANDRLLRMCRMRPLYEYVPGIRDRKNAISNGLDYKVTR